MSNGVYPQLPSLVSSLEILHVILSASFGSGSTAAQILRCAQDDMQDPAQGRSREVFSPNV